MSRFNPDAAFQKFLKSHFESESEAVNRKFSDVFGVSFQGIIEFCDQDIDEVEFSFLASVSPIILLSITQKDKGESVKILQKISTFKCMQNYLLVGRQNVGHTVNKALIRLFCLCIVFHGFWDKLNKKSKIVKGVMKAREIKSVLNLKGGGSEAKKKIAEETIEKMDERTDEETSVIDEHLDYLFAHSYFAKGRKEKKSSGKTGGNLVDSSGEASNKGLEERAPVTTSNILAHLPEESSDEGSDEVIEIEEEEEEEQTTVVNTKKMTKKEKQQAAKAAKSKK